MMELFGNLAILNPLVLAGFAVLPAIWWLLRVLPPSPNRVSFPGLVFLRGLTEDERDSAHTPWWLLVLRMVLAALFIAGLAGPVLNQALKPAGKGPLVLMIDDSWAAAGRWDQHMALAGSLIRQAGENARAIALVTTTPSRNPVPLTLMTADDASARLAALEPRPLRPDRANAARQIRTLADFGQAEIIWLSDGLEAAGTEDLITGLESAARLVLVTDRPGTSLLGLTLPDAGAAGLSARIIRGTGLEIPVSGFLEAYGGETETMRLIARQPFTLEPGQSSADLSIDLPLDLANRVSHLSLADQNTAGAVALLDDRWRRQRIGLVSGRSIEAAQPLLSDLYYLERALNAGAVVERGTVESLTGRIDPPAAIVLADVGRLNQKEQEDLENWIDRGGLLIRFAGPRLAALAAEPVRGIASRLLPVRLRAGGRALGGALTWQTPQHLAPYPPDSPFTGLPVPGDVAITRQVLAEPDPSLSEKTWARLTDGTPLVTSVARGRGRIALVHVTANPQWSSLPLSGLYPDMLKRMLELAPGLIPDGAPIPTPSAASLSSAPGSAGGTYRPMRLLDGFGVLGTPADQRPIAAGDLARGSRAGIQPGLYEGPRTNSDRAVNMLDSADDLTPLPASLAVTSRAFYAEAPEIDFGPWLLLGAALLLVLDTLISLSMRGLLRLRPSRRHKSVAAAIIAALAVLTLLPFPSPVQAQTTSEAAKEEAALQATITTRLGYILTRDAQVDRLSRAGLTGLTRIIGARTSIEAGDPVALDPETDELVFYPLIYWPVLADQPALSPGALQKVDSYLKHGGVILFDTRDEQSAPVYQIGGGLTPALAALRQLVGSLDLPPLEPVPQDHVLTKAFYLLQTFPGRWTGGEVWVEASSVNAAFDSQSPSSGRTNDGVSPIIIGSHDWAAAWAIDEAGRPLAELVPGGVRQRELAFRFGVNLVMYALTGNYKTDQVHVPALLERLGQ